MKSPAEKIALWADQLRDQAASGLHFSQNIYEKERCLLLHLYHFTFLAEPKSATQLGNGSHKHEILDVSWFSEDHLPQDMDPGHVTIVPHAYRVWHGDERPFF